MAQQRWPRLPRPVLLRAIALAVPLLIGCRTFDESLLPTDAALDGTADASAVPEGGGPDGGVDAAAACPLLRPPPRPTVPDGPDPGEVLFALRNINLGQDDDDWRTIGYDLDGLCSIAPEPVVECRAPAASSIPELDGEGGIDNALGHQVLPLLLVVRPNVASDATRDQNNGVSVFLLRVRGWNGGPDDPVVDAVLSISEFGVPALPDGGMPTPEIPDGNIRYGEGGTFPPPEWDGQDWWWARADNYFAGDPERPRIRDDRAYVADRTIVMRLPDAMPLVLTGGYRSVIFKLTDAVLTARLSEDGLLVEGAVVAGRWPMSEMLASAAASGICPGTEDYARLSRLIDLSADIRATPGTGGPGTICDALSVGVTLDGVRAHFGGISDKLGVPDACANAGLDGGVDGGVDAGLDGGLDAGLDAGSDAGPADASSDAAG